MGRPQRVNSGGLVYHVLNRANVGGRIFRGAKDYAAWERVLAEAVERYDTRVLGYALMPNHWHLVLWPRKDGELSRFVGWLTLTHTQRWHAARQTVGGGHVYQGRFKSFVIQPDEHLYTVCRYVERNPLRANLVTQAEEWRWCSLWRMTAGNADERALLSDWPEPRPGNWLSYVNGIETEAELAAVRRSIQRGVPFGEPDWTKRMVRKLGLETTIRPRGRPKSPGKGS
jgi:putative transposase